MLRSRYRLMISRVGRNQDGDGTATARQRDGGHGGPCSIAASAHRQLHNGSGLSSMIGTQVGQFRVLKLLGEGGMGSVYLAEHVVIKKQRALKLLRPEWMQNQNIVRRFINEAIAAASLEHRNIIVVHDFFKLGDGTTFMVMDYLDGSTLNHFLATQQVPPPLHVCLQILSQIANGLAAAHRGGIIHRDLKPDNIFLVVRDPNPYHVVILDFGVAKLTEQQASGAMTRTSAVVGTPAYTAAEQLRGGTIDSRVDIFSLGVIAYQMVTGGWLPFQNTASRNEYYELTAAELYHRQMTQTATDPRKYVPDLPEGWAAAISAALNRDPNKRPADLHEFALALANATPGNAFQPGGMAVLESYARELLQTGVSRATILAPSGAHPIIPSIPGPSIPVLVALAPDGSAPVALGAAPAVSAGMAPTTPAEPVATPNSAARYKLGAKLGTGGMAEVFVGTASGAEGFTRTVAIKRVLPGLSELPTFATMFVQEARIACRLSHPNIVTVFDFDRDAEGRLFLAMEFVDGKDLTALLASGPVPAPVAIFLAIEMLRGLGYAHDLPNLEGGPRGVVHRDVSPQNVLLSWEGAVKVSDFGLAKARDASSGVSGTVKGKVAWMSPEQANAEPLDGRTDLWAVGVMLWELLVGQSLFKGTFTEVIAQVMFREIVPPRGAPPDVAAVVMKLLTRPRHARYANAEEAILDLAACHDCPRDGRSELMRLLSERFPREAHTQIAMHTPRRISDGRLNPRSPTGPPPNTAAGAASETMPRPVVARRWVWPVVSGAAIAAAITAFAIVTQKPRSGGTTSDVTMVATNTPATPGSGATDAAVVADAGTHDAAVAAIVVATAHDAGAAAAVAVQHDTPTTEKKTDAQAQTSKGSDSPPKQPDKPRDPVSRVSRDAASNAGATRKSTTREKGELDVTVLRTYAEVYVDSVHIGTTPIHTRLPVGPHRITLVNKDIKQRQSVNVVVTTAEPVTIEKPW